MNAMKNYVFSIVMNIVAAIALFGAGSQKMNNLTTSIPAILCIIAAILAIIQLKRGMDK